MCNTATQAPDEHATGRRWQGSGGRRV